jgi:ABC-type dipeptide/oligopeptide/nickel transport system permease subunit
VIKYVLIGTFVACYGGVFGTLIMTMINVLRASPSLRRRCTGC